MTLTRIRPDFSVAREHFHILGIVYGGRILILLVLERKYGVSMMIHPRIIIQLD